MEVGSFQTSQHLINRSIKGEQRMQRRYYSHRSLNELHSVETFQIPPSNPIIATVTAPGCIVIKHRVCASEVSPTETKSRGVENGASDVEGEWNCSRVPSFVKATNRKGTTGRKARGRSSTSCRGNYSARDKTIDVKFKTKSLSQVVDSFCLFFESILLWF